MEAIDKLKITAITIITILLALIISFIIGINKVYAIQKLSYITINGTTMDTNVVKYTAGNANQTILIKFDSSNNPITDDTPIYGYVGICSALGSDSARQINTVSAGLLTDLRIYNTSKGCTIYNKPAYNLTARVLYVTFEIPLGAYNCSISGSSCYIQYDIGFYIYQPGSNEYQVVGNGFSNEPYDFSSDVTNGDLIFSETQVIAGKQQEMIDKQTSTNAKLDRAYDEDLSASDKQNVDSTNINTYNQKEGELMQFVTQADMSGLNVAIDTTANQSIWTLINRLVNTHAAVYGLFITILSIGIIKLMLVR